MDMQGVWLMARYSYFDDFTERERGLVVAKMLEEGQTWKDIIKRFGHPRDWEENDPQMRLFKDIKDAN